MVCVYEKDATYVNVTGVAVDSLDVRDATRAEIVLRRQIATIVDFFRKTFPVLQAAMSAGPQTASVCANRVLWNANMIFHRRKSKIVRVLKTRLRGLAITTARRAS